MTILPEPFAEDRLLTSAEVARLFRVDPTTVSQWSRSGKLRSIKTPGGRHRRYRESDVRALLADEAGAAQDVDAAPGLAGPLSGSAAEALA